MILKSSLTTIFNRKSCIIQDLISTYNRTQYVLDKILKREVQKIGLS
jgi:hypothetical protein